MSAQTFTRTHSQTEIDQDGRRKGQNRARKKNTRMVKKTQTDKRECAESFAQTLRK